MPGRMTKRAALCAAIVTMALIPPAQAGSHKASDPCAGISGHAAAMAGCGGVSAAGVHSVFFSETHQVQSKLALLGYDLGNHGVDGRMGPRSRAALLRFQRDHGLTADGRIGVQTRVMLNYVTQQYRAFGQRM